MPQTQIAYHPFQGGLDLVSPVLNIPPGYVLDGINYEPDINGGYRRIEGYERFDGQPSPSVRKHTILLLNSTDGFKLGDTLTGQSSQGLGIVVLNDSKRVCLCSTKSSFRHGETVSNGNTTAVIESLDYTLDSIEGYAHQERWQAIENHYRQRIKQPPGDGAIEGVCHYQGITFAFRRKGDNITLSKSSKDSWEVLPQKKYMRFYKGGNRIPNDGDTFTTQIGTTGKVYRYIRQGGSSEDLSVYGYFMLDTINGDLAHNDRLELGSYDVAKVHSKDYLAITVENVSVTSLLPPVGKLLRNEAGAKAKLHETILRQPGNSSDRVDVWMLLSDIKGEFKEGDAVRRIIDREINPPPEPKPEDKDKKELEPIPEPLGTIKGTPLKAIRLKDHGDDPKRWPDTGDVIQVGSPDNEARVFWRNYYGVSLPVYGAYWFVATIIIGTGNDKDYVGFRKNSTGAIDPYTINYTDDYGKEVTTTIQWFCRKDNKYLIFRVEGVDKKPDGWPDQITIIAEDERMVLTWKDKDEKEKIEPGYQEDFGFNATYDPWRLADRKGETIRFQIYKDAITFKEERRLYLTLKDITGTIDIDSNVSVLEVAGYANGTVQPITVKAGGVFDFRTWNFYARPEQTRIYGCNGQGPAFELDPNTGLICPILMPKASDQNNPHCLEVHKHHLFLGLPGGKLRHSVIGEPLNFNGQLGAFETGVGDEVTELVSHPGDVIVVVCRNRIQGLYGNTVDDWKLNMIADNAGGYVRSAQLLGQCYMLDDNGLISLQRVQAYGNFEHAAVSRRVQPWIDKWKDQVTGSTVVRDKNLICLYFKGGEGMTVKPDPQQDIPEIMPFRYPVTINCVNYAEDKQGNSRIFFGTTDGWIYEARKGTNFDGEPIEAAIRTAYNTLQSPALRKAFKRIELMLSGGYEVELYVGMELDYGSPQTPHPIIRTFTIYSGEGGYWNEDNWSEFYWSSQDVSTADVTVSGTGKNYSLMFYSNSAWIQPYTLQGAIIHYIPRRLDRG